MSSLTALNLYASIDRRKTPTRCGTCKRGPLYYQGCSVVDCPQRKLITATVGQQNKRLSDG
jgi:hypothetical protein